MIVGMQHNLQIIPIPAFEDNYIWLIHNGKQALVVDPGDAMPVFARLKQFNLTLSTILITHHHHDHIDGVGQLRAAFPEVKIYAPKLEQYRFVHTPVSEPDIVTISALNLSFKVIDVPGHTFGHIAYYAEPAAGSHWLFSGDVLFGAGCGRVPEESYAIAYQSLQKLAALPTSTQVYCTHEYTLQNIRFALTLEPNNPALIMRFNETRHCRDSNVPSLPTTIDLEFATNPYLRCASDEIRSSLKMNDEDDAAVFRAIRILKDNY